MIQKSGKFLADWRDEKGVRERKAFSSRRNAIRYQRRKAAEAASKKVQASVHSAKSLRHGSKAARTPRRKRG